MSRKESRRSSAKTQMCEPVCRYLQPACGFRHVLGVVLLLLAGLEHGESASVHKQVETRVFSLPTRDLSYTAERSSAASISDNLLPAIPDFRITAIRTAGSDTVFLLGDHVSNKTVNLLCVRKDGTQKWTATFGDSSDGSEGNALYVDDDGNAYIAGKGVRDDVDTTVSGALLSKYSSDGDLIWSSAVGSLTSGDTLHDISKTRDGTLVAVGSIGDQSPVLETAPDTDQGRFALLLIFNEADGVVRASTVLRTDPGPGREEGIDERLLSVAYYAPANTIVAGGVSDGRSALFLYQNQIEETPDGETVPLLHRLVLQGGSGIEDLVIALSRSRVYTVGACELTTVTIRRERLETSSRREVSLDDCVSNIKGITLDGGETNVLMLLDGEVAPSIAKYSLDSEELESVVKAEEDAIQATSLTSIGDGRALLSGYVRTTTSDLAWMSEWQSTGTPTETLDSKNESDALEADSNSRRNQILKITAISTTGLVLVGALVLIVSIVHHTRSTGEPA